MRRWWIPVALTVGSACDRAEGQALSTPAAISPSTAAALVRPPQPGRKSEPTEPTEPTEPAPGFTGTLTFVPGSTTKVDTLIGDVDRETGDPTLSLTETRYGIIGTDLGSSFEHDGRAWFLFGDTLGPIGGDVLATTVATEGDDGVRLDFLTSDDGQYLRIRPDGVSMGGFEVPSAGISLGGTPYVVVKTNHTEGESEDASVLTRLDESRGAFTELREISRLPDGRFVKMSLHEVPEPIEGLPDGGPWVLMWGTGEHRASDAWLAIVPVDTFETGRGTRYYSGEGPEWSRNEAHAVPIVEHPTMGDLSVTWVAELGVWLMVYDSRDPRAVVVRYSTTPWGPWSELQEIFTRDDGVGRFIHEPGEDDGLAGPMIGPDRDPMEEHGGAYAPYVVERFTRVEDDVLAFYYTLSTWNPYLVVLMRSELAVSP